MNEGIKCRRRSLAKRASFSVEQCECGAIHVTVGYITIRLEPCAYREMAMAVIEALERLPAGRPTIH